VVPLLKIVYHAYPMLPSEMDSVYVAMEYLPITVKINVHRFVMAAVLLVAHLIAIVALAYPYMPTWTKMSAAIVFHSF